MKIEEFLKEIDKIKEFVKLLHELNPVFFDPKKLEFMKETDMLKIKYPMNSLSSDDIKTLAKHDIHVNVVSQNNKLYLVLILPLFGFSQSDS